MAEETEIMSALREMWEVADPPPAGLTDRMISVVATADLDLEMLLLVGESEFAGARSQDVETSKLEFSNGDLSVLVLLDASSGTRRLDGWIAPSEPEATVRLVVDGGDIEEPQETTAGRFSYEHITSTGMARLIVAVPASGNRPARAFATPAFEI